LSVLIIFAGLATVVFLSPIGTIIIDRLSNAFEFRDASAVDRGVRALTGLKLFVTNPLAGVGPGGYAFFYPRMGGLDISTMVTPSNFWLGVLTDVGIIGLIPLVIFILRVTTLGLQKRECHPLTAAYRWSIISFLILLVTNDIWFIEILWFEFAFLLVLSSNKYQTRVLGSGA
jgi:O-antigen ligase